MATKTQIQEMLNKHNITDTIVVNDFLSLIASKGGVSSRPSNIMFEDNEYYFCRNSGHYFLLENMVKDKNGKSKGYSSIGNSIYTQAQKYKKGLLLKIDSLKDEFIAVSPSDADYTSKTDEIRESMVKFQQSIDEGDFSNGAWMTDKFLASLKPERIELFNNIAFTKEELNVVEAKPAKKK